MACPGSGPEKAGFALAIGVALVLGHACNDELIVGAYRTPAQIEAGADATTDAEPGTDADSPDATTCVVTKCQNHVYACGDCIDNDGDGLIDAEDPDCLGPCHNAEDTFYSSIPGGSSTACEQDCYFDQDTGMGNDGCLWTRHCDPLEVPPYYHPAGEQCAYDATTTVSTGGSRRSCNDLIVSQTEKCQDFCLPLTPNGCDCFGCCTIPGAPTPVWLGSVDADGKPTCSRKALAHPSLCRPCTQVTSCLNTCERCELCIGKKEVPEDCLLEDASADSQCPPGITPCGLEGQAPCESGTYCITGCCVSIVR